MKYLSLCFILFISGCSTSIQEYRGEVPEFDIKQYFQGKIVARGIVQDYSRKVVRRFCVDIDARWDNNRGTLDEYFYYADGEQQQRTWTLNVDENNNVTGQASDFKGMAIGEIQGNAFRWQYVMPLEVGGTEYDFNVDDWMFLLSSTQLVNRSYIKKLGITVAEVTLFFDKQGTQCEKAP